MIMTPIRAVVFDRDQTLLYDASDQLIQRYQKVIPELTADDFSEHWNRMSHRAPAHPDKDLEFWTEFFRRVVESKGGRRGQAVSLTQIFFQIHTLYSQFSDTTPCLTELRRRGYILAVLTNHPLGNVDTAFRHVGLEPAWFKAIVNAYPDRKPSPFAYWRILDALGVAAEQCLFVDDDVDNVRGAIAVAMQAILIDRKGPCKMHPEVVTIDGLDRLLELLPDKAGGPVVNRDSPYGAGQHRDGAKLGTAVTAQRARRRSWPARLAYAGAHRC